MQEETRQIECPICSGSYKGMKGLGSHFSQTHPSENFDEYRMEIGDEGAVYCENCGKVSHKWPSDLEKCERHFCSKECFDEFRRKQGSTRVECAYCGKRVWRMDCKVEKSENLFCSMECYTKWQKENKYRIVIDFKGKKKPVSHILGVVLSDGSVIGDRRVELETTNKVFAKSFKDSLQCLGCSPCMRNYEKANPNYSLTYSVATSSKMLAGFLKPFLDFPNLISRREDELDTKEIIRGFYEGDGSCAGRKNRVQQQIIPTFYNSNRVLLESIHQLLTGLNFDVSPFYKRERTLEVRILGGTQEHKRFYREIKPKIKNPLIQS